MQRNPNQDRKCGLICCMLVPRCGARHCSPQAHAQLQLQSRHKKAPGEQKRKKEKPTEQHSTRVTISETAGARPSPLPVHKSQHEVYTTKLVRLWSLSKYLGTKSECFLGTARTQTA